METDKIMLQRRAMLSSILGAGLGVSIGLPAWAAMPQYPQLVDPAIPVLNLTQGYFVASASAGSRLFAVGQEGVIIYSDDSGQSWHQAAVPVSATITDIAFATPQVGWAVGALGVVLNTQDGGKTWVKQLDGIAEIGLMNTATQTFTSANPPNSDANAQAYVAATAASQPPVDPVAAATRRAQILSGQGPDKPMLSILPVSATEVFVFGTYRYAEHSTDGGKTWTDWSMHIGDPKSHNIYGASAIGGALYLVSEEGLIFRSTDGGQSFQQLAQPGSATFFGICDTGAGGILAYGVAGEMYLSTDQGKTWNQPQFGGTSNVNAVISIGNGMLVAGDAGGGLWLSKDHGATFTLLQRNPLMGINALQPTGGSRFLVVSDIGVFPVDLSTLSG
jgi:photosystem II stability/assembly factor-like uncharacterized protein